MPENFGFGMSASQNYKKYTRCNLSVRLIKSILPTGAAAAAITALSVPGITHLL